MYCTCSVPFFCCLDLTLPPSTTGVRIELVLTWGDFHYMGLTGLELVGKDGKSLPLDISMMAALPRDLNDLPEYGHDLRTLDKCVLYNIILC